MDDDDDVVCIEAPVPTNARTQRPVARKGGAVRVRFNGEGSESASFPVRAGKFKKQRRAHREYVLPKELMAVRRYATGSRRLRDLPHAMARTMILGDGNDAFALPSDGDGMHTNLWALYYIVSVCAC